MNGNKRMNTTGHIIETSSILINERNTKVLAQGLHQFSMINKQ